MWFFSCFKDSFFFFQRHIYIHINIYICKCTNTEREKEILKGGSVFKCTFYLSLSILLKLTTMFSVALKVSCLVFYPLLGLIPVNNQHRIKLKSKQYLLHELEEVNTSFCKMWMCPVYELSTCKTYWFFFHGRLYPTPTTGSGTFSLTSVGFGSRFLISLILVWPLVW